MNQESRFAYAKGKYATGLESVRTTPAPKRQKFPPGTRVKTKEGSKATAKYTYEHAYGDLVTDSHKLYSLDIDGFGKSAWHNEEELTPI